MSDEPRKTMDRNSVIEVIAQTIADEYFDWDDGSGTSQDAELEEASKIAEMIMKSFEHFNMTVTCIDED